MTQVAKPLKTLPAHSDPVTAVTFNRLKRAIVNKESKASALLEKAKALSPKLKDWSHPDQYNMFKGTLNKLIKASNRKTRKQHEKKKLNEAVIQDTALWYSCRKKLYHRPTKRRTSLPKEESVQGWFHEVLVFAAKGGG